MFKQAELLMNVSSFESLVMQRKRSWCLNKSMDDHPRLNFYPMNSNRAHLVPSVIVAIRKVFLQKTDRLYNELVGHCLTNDFSLIMTVLHLIGIMP